MSLSKILPVISFSAALIAFAPPAYAQHHGGGGGHSGGGGGHSGGGGGHSGGGSGASANRGGGQARAAAPRSAPASRSGSAAVPRYSGGRPSSGGRPGYYYRGGGPRYSIVAPARFYRPYYAFRPRLSLGFGLWAGYPFAYSYPFYDPFYYPYGPYGYYGYPYGGNYTLGPNGYPPYGSSAPNYPYPSNGNPSSSGYPSTAAPNYSTQAEQNDPQASIGVQADQSNTGGVSFEITPNTAELFVDGTKVGTVGQFTPTSQPLGLPAGHHKIEVRAGGYQSMSFDVDIIAGQVIPYQGSMER